MTKQSCPCCGEKMNVRRSFARDDESVYECRACHVAYVTREQVEARTDTGPLPR
jgi:transposase-like protein